MKTKLLAVCCFFMQFVIAQRGTLTVEKIMQDQKWIGISPSDIRWTPEGVLFFSWNPEKALSDSVYYLLPGSIQPVKATTDFEKQLVSAEQVRYNRARTFYTYERSGDIFIRNIKKKNTVQLTFTADAESDPVFIYDDQIAFRRQQNIYSWNPTSGSIRQLTNFIKGPAPKDPQKGISAQDKWLKEDQLREFEILQLRKMKRDSADAMRKRRAQNNDIKPIYLGDKNLTAFAISPEARFITYKTEEPVILKNTIVPDFVTESGYTTDKIARAKVGETGASSEFFVWDLKKDSVIKLNSEILPGIKDITDFEKEYKKQDTGSINKKNREVNFYGPVWNNEGSYALFEARAHDNKDRWILIFNAKTHKIIVADRQRDEAWIGGPGINLLNRESWIDENTFWFQSENTGYSHIYVMNAANNEKRQLTSGNYEVLKTVISPDHKFFYITSNEKHPGEQHFYKVKIADGTKQQLTSEAGQHVAIISPDESKIAYLYSYTNKPPELFIRAANNKSMPFQVTHMSQSEEFKKYPWRDPGIITFKARDGALVYARLYKPDTENKNKPAVIFVHGAGYLQNAHKWWSSYSREYMFHNLLADKGYTVLDIDYRGSAGYGRNWRTGIYRHMGGKDLTDHVDGARMLVENYGVNKDNIGIYGGSYGGFITLMAMFTEQGIFAAGAALRSVTDWAHYNHGYTSNILNEPVSDTSAYKKSSPLYFAGGLRGALLMCHGMVDTNVHFQDIVRLAQRLIELKKENWELAVYPVEDHGFTEPSSWTDEYKRILKLFETNINKDK